MIFKQRDLQMFFPQKIALWTVLLLSVLQLTNVGVAQTKTTPDALQAQSLELQGQTMANKPFQLSALKGKVTLVMFWSTTCPVCRDQMPELRENIKGWADKPFELVLVSVDKSMKDVDDYFKYLNQIVPAKQQFTQLWALSAGYKDNIRASQIPLKQLPVTYLIDKQGKISAIYKGRIPAQAWDDIAELL
jgi:cytochrome oxidase Cu insertion factor (SCO1/SenC/PrrC family)